MFRPTQRPFVLLIDDSPDDAFFFLRTLRVSGLAGRVVHVDDGGLAIQYLAKATADEGQLPDLVFLDLKMPTVNGFEVLSWIRTQRFSPPLDIAVLSGSEQGDDVERALALGAAAYYVKPILDGQLKARFSTWQEKQSNGNHPEEAHVAGGPNGPL
jgi:CheY-like chemotaxis protein